MSDKEVENEIKKERQRLGVSKSSKGHKIIKTIEKQVVGKRKRKGFEKDKSGNWVPSGKLFDTYKTEIIGKYKKPSEKSRTKSGQSYNYGITCVDGYCNHEEIFEEQLHGGLCFCLCHKENKRQSTSEILDEAEAIGNLLEKKN